MNKLLILAILGFLLGSAFSMRIQGDKCDTKCDEKCDKHPDKGCCDLTKVYNRFDDIDIHIKDIDVDIDNILVVVNKVNKYFDEFEKCHDKCEDKPKCPCGKDKCDEKCDKKEDKCEEKKKDDKCEDKKPETPCEKDKKKDEKCDEKKPEPKCPCGNDKCDGRCKKPSTGDNQCGESDKIFKAWTDARYKVRYVGGPGSEEIKQSAKAAWDAGATLEQFACITFNVAVQTGISTCDCINTAVQYTYSKGASEKKAQTYVDKAVYALYSWYEGYQATCGTRPKCT